MTYTDNRQCSCDKNDPAYYDSHYDLHGTIRDMIYGAPITDTLAARISTDICEDLVLPELGLAMGCRLELVVGLLEVSIQIGPRDMHWDIATEKLTGSGTFMHRDEVAR